MTPAEDPGISAVSLAALPATHPVVVRLHAASRTGDVSAIQALRALPPSCEARRSWAVARQPELEHWYELSRVASSVIGSIIQSATDVESLAQDFWTEFCDRGWDLQFDSRHWKRETWVAIKARFWAISRLRSMMARPPEQQLFVEPDSAPDPPAPPDCAVLWRRLEHQLVRGSLRPRDALVLLLAESGAAGPAALASAHIESPLEQLLELLRDPRFEIPSSMIDCLARGLDANTSFRELTAGAGRAPAAVIADWLETARRVARDGVRPAGWPPIEDLAAEIEQRMRAEIESRVAFLLTTGASPALLPWGLRRILSLPDEEFTSLSVGEATADLRERVNLLLGREAITASQALALVGSQPERPMAELLAELPARAVRGVEERYRERVARVRRAA